MKEGPPFRTCRTNRSPGRKHHSANGYDGKVAIPTELETHKNKENPCLSNRGLRDVGNNLHQEPGGRVASRDLGRIRVRETRQAPAMNLCNMGPRWRMNPVAET